MYKIKSVTFKDHPILGNLHLNFCDLTGNAVDTVIIAGENGTGKSTVLDALYSAVCFSTKVNLGFQIEEQGRTITLDYSWSDTNKNFQINDGINRSTHQGSTAVWERYPFRAIFSDVDINFSGNAIQNVGSTELDKQMRNQKSTLDLPTQIKQLIVDIQSSDDADTAESYREAKAKGGNITAINPGNRMSRFTEAFNKMFDGLTYTKVTNVQTH